MNVNERETRIAYCWSCHEETQHTKIDLHIWDCNECNTQL